MRRLRAASWARTVGEGSLDASIARPVPNAVAHAARRGLESEVSPIGFTLGTWKRGIPSRLSRAWGDRVAYLSQYYTSGSRAHHMAIKLCDRIGGPGASVEWKVSPKPKWIRSRIYEQLLRNAKKSCDKATVLPREYRLASDVV